MIGRVLVIAGSDSGGGAGIQADLKAVMAMGAYAATAITAVTAQNTLGVQAVFALPPGIVRAQIVSVLTDIGADVVKIGMLGDAATIDAVADALEEHAPRTPLVLDPVMVAKGGASLLAGSAVDALKRHLLPRATLLTPNLPEAEALLDQPIIEGEEAARALLHLGAQSVLLKGGHGTGATVVDLLAHDGAILRFEAPRIATLHTHGTGCTLASAVAANLAQGLGMTDAVRRAQLYVQAAIRTAPGLGGGHGPLNHAAPVQAP